MLRVTHPAGADDWNTAVLGMPGYDYRQGWEWAEHRRDEHWRPFRLLATRHGRPAAAVQILLRDSPLGALMDAPRGPLCLDASALPPLLDAVARLARDHRAILLRTSPPVASTFVALRDLGLQELPDLATLWNVPRADLTLDLSGEPEHIRSRFHRKTRQYVDRATREGLRFETVADPHRLHALLIKNASRQSFAPPSLARLRSLCEAYRGSSAMLMLLARLHEQDVGAMLSLVFGTRISFIYLGVDLDRFDALKPGYSLYWEAIRRAKQQGCVTSDWGAAGTHDPPRPTDEGYSLWQFKARFGCEVSSAPPYVDLVLSRRRYRLFRVAERRFGAVVRRWTRRVRDLSLTRSRAHPARPRSR